MYNIKQIETAVKSKSHLWFENGDYNVNIVTVRTVKIVEGKRNNAITNLFDDFITISYKENGVWKFHCWPATTDPGTTSMQKFGNKNGTAILVPGQYRGTHTIRKHNGQYDAVCQKIDAVLKVFRDNNKDGIYNMDKIFTDASGVNIHKAGPSSTWVNGWSAGCQVFKYAKDFDEFMKICKKSAKLYNNSFTVTLIESTDIK